MSDCRVVTMELSLSGRSVIVVVPGNTAIDCTVGIVWMTFESRRFPGPCPDVVLCAGERRVVAEPGVLYLSALGTASSAEVCVTFAASSQIQVATRLTSSRGVSSAEISQYELGLGAGVPASGTTLS